MKINMIFVLLGLFFSFTSCSSALQYTEVDTWLATKAGIENATVNVSGVWEDVNKNQVVIFDWGRGGVDITNWGPGTFEQKGQDVTGNLNAYLVKGKVSGDTLFMVLLSANTPYYLAKLKLIGNKRLSGTYYYPKDKELENSYPMTLNKVE